MLTRKIALTLSTCALGSFVSAGTGHHPGTEMDRKAGAEMKHNQYSDNSRYQVKQVQKALNENGYSVDVDGVMGTKTSNALHEYQLENGLEPNHRLDQATLASLGVINSQTQDWHKSAAFENKNSFRRPASVDNDNQKRIFRDDEMYSNRDRMKRMNDHQSFNTITAGFGIPESSLEEERPHQTKTMTR